MVSPVAGDVDGADCPEGAEKLEPLAGGSGTDLKALRDLLGVQRCPRHKEKPIYLTNRLGKANQLHEADEEVDGLDLQIG